MQGAWRSLPTVSMPGLATLPPLSAESPTGLGGRSTVRPSRATSYIFSPDTCAVRQYERRTRYDGGPYNCCTANHGAFHDAKQRYVICM
jgi:hypothetical protein